MIGCETVDCIYVAASRRDGRYTRTCVASVRRFYPEVAIRLLAGGRLERGLAAELRRYWGVEQADMPAGDYGWGFVKLEPLFGQPGERFLMLDSDTVITGPVLQAWNNTSAPFLVDDERQSESDAKRLYYDWDRLCGQGIAVPAPQFVFNSGQWFGTAGVLQRDDFSPWMEWSMPRRVRYPDLFVPSDQGVLNLVLNDQVRTGRARVARAPLLRWPGHGLQDFTEETVTASTCPPRVIHWAGMRAARLKHTPGADILLSFERRYYQQLPASSLRRHVNATLHTSRQYLARAHVQAALLWRRLAQRCSMENRH